MGQLSYGPRHFLGGWSVCNQTNRAESGMSSECIGNARDDHRVDNRVSGLLEDQFGDGA